MATIAGGVTVKFGASIGGVHFSIDLTTNTNNFYNLLKHLYSETVTVIIFKSCKLLVTVALFDTSNHNFYLGSFPVGLNQELPIFMMIAVMMYLFGSFYIFVHRDYCAMKL